MTEAEWLSCRDTEKMMDFLLPILDEPKNLLGGETSDRKLRLLACGLARLLWNKLQQPEVRSAVEFAERVADGQIQKKRSALLKQLREVYQTASDSIGFGLRGKMACYVGVATASSSACAAAFTVVRDAGKTGLQKKGVAVVIHDIFGNPFRPITCAPEWRTGTATVLARQMYESRDFSAMPILADALQDAGCDSDDILSHCRGNGPHVRGCWVVDLVLGKE